MNSKCVTLVGGINRLEHHYRTEATKLGVSLVVFNEHETQMDSRLRNSDAVVIFTNKVSHVMKSKAVRVAKARKIPVFYFHTCGIHTLRSCLECLEKGKASASCPLSRGKKEGR